MSIVIRIGLLGEATFGSRGKREIISFYARYVSNIIITIKDSLVKPFVIFSYKLTEGVVGIPVIVSCVIRGICVNCYSSTIIYYKFSVENTSNFKKIL